MNKNAFDRMQVFLIRAKSQTPVVTGSIKNVTTRNELRGLADRLLQQVASGERAFLASARIQRTTAGRPYLHGSSAYGWPALSISHRGNYLALALHEMAVGVDLEVLRKREHYLEMAERVFHFTEVTRLRKHAPADGQRLFYTYWTMREALTKASGVPLLQLRASARILKPSDPSPRPAKTSLFHTSLGSKLQLACCGSVSACPRIYLCTRNGRYERELFPEWQRYELNWVDPRLPSVV